MNNNPFKGLAHMCIYTQSNEKSIDFYCNGMGFEIYHREMMGTHVEPTRMFPADFCLVKLGELYIELIECFGPWNGTPQDKKHPYVLGVIDHFGIEVDNVDNAVKQLKDWGLSALCHPAGIRTFHKSEWLFRFLSKPKDTPVGSAGFAPILHP